MAGALGNAGGYLVRTGGGHALYEQKTKGTNKKQRVGGGGKDLAECLIVAVDTFGKIVPNQSICNLETPILGDSNQLYV